MKTVVLKNNQKNVLIIISSIRNHFISIKLKILISAGNIVGSKIRNGVYYFLKIQRFSLNKYVRKTDLNTFRFTILVKNKITILSYSELFESFTIGFL
jgi:hypothetical protein